MVQHVLLEQVNVIHQMILFVQVVVHVIMLKYGIYQIVFVQLGHF
jgi:hypothetical protein